MLIFLYTTTTIVHKYSLIEMYPVVLCGLVASIFLLILHTFSLTILICRRKTLGKNTFYRLVLYLSVSDACFGIEFIYSSLIYHFSNHNWTYIYQDIIVTNLLGGTIVFSIFQTWQIYIEQLNATFAARKRHLTALTSTRTSGIGCIVCHLFTIFRIAADISKYKNTKPKADEISAAVNGVFYITVEFPGTLFLASNAILCILLLHRIRCQNKKIHQSNGIITEQQHRQIKNNQLRIKQNMITLVILLFLAFISFAPRVMFVSFMLMTENTESAYWINIIHDTNFLLMVKPLFDPFVYILRIESVRNDVKRLLCCCLK